MSKEDLKVLRSRIDEIDHSLAELLGKRLETARSIGVAKGDGPVYDPVREAQIIEKFKGLLPQGDPEALAAIHREIISMCRSAQARLRVACMGPEGSFSQQAVFKALGHSVDPLFVDSPGSVFAAIEEELCGFGIVPVENTIEGVVCPTLDGFASASKVFIIKEINIPIRHVLASKCAEMSKVREVRSHPQALAQCRAWLDTNLPGVPRIPVATTSVAATMAAEDRSVAAVCSGLAAELNDLTLLKEGIQDQANNTTRFWVLGRNRARSGERDKTSILFSISHRPGALLDALEPLREAEVNLTLIQSRPMPGNPFEYLFFVDFEGPAGDSVVSALAEMEKRCFHLRVLGSYGAGL